MARSTPSYMSVRRAPPHCSMLLIRPAKHRVDRYIVDLDLPATFVLTGTFYDNLIFRKHIVYLKESDSIEFRHPVIKPDTKRE